MQNMFRDAGVSVHNYAKELNIDVGLIDICNGSASKELACEPYIDCAFPLVRSIKLSFIQPDGNEIASPDFKFNIYSFVRRIKEMTPSTKKIIISIKPRTISFHWYPTYQLDILMAQLSQLAIDIEYDIERQPIIIDQQLSGLCSLSFSRFDSAYNAEQVYQLAQRNASTLKYLNIVGVATLDIAGLIQSIDGNYIQYHCLHTLKLHGSSLLGGSQHLVFPGAVPFPNLRCLRFGGGCSFGDDTLFRGNAATLESLTIFLDPVPVQVLREYRVFTPVSHPRLQHIKLRIKSGSEANIFSSDAEYMRFVLGMGPNATVLDIFDLLDGPGLQSIVPVLGEHSSLQVLSMPFVSFRFWEVVSLVKALPLLSDLYTSMPAIEPRPTGVPKHKLPAYVIDKYASVGKRFRCWHISIVDDQEWENLVRCLLLLALICPNFDYANIGIVWREVFMAHMKRMITTDGFRPYATRLRRLLFGGWNNKIPSVKVLEARHAAFVAQVSARIERRNIDAGQE
ncbi:hypothetical protein FBU31_000989 [Coemansia sp. 'formosensis']|nr:hypothetical protein FBU31_000989 [Coemansia sp. 'formosensis']